jgi:Mg2+/citrate symporter
MVDSLIAAGVAVAVFWLILAAGHYLGIVKGEGR